MTKTVSSDLQDHLDEEVTTLSRCWRIIRTDGTELHFTDHDADLEFPVDSGTIYKAMEGFSATAVTTNAALDVDNLNVMGIFNDESIDEDEIAAGLYDYAEVRLFIVNWAGLSQGPLKMRRGWFGEAIKSPSGIFKVELRGLTQILQQSIGELYGPECRADLGDHRCKVPLDPDLIARSTVYSVGDYVKVITDSGASGYDRFENRIYKCINGGITAAVQPVYDTVVGNTTDDGGASSGGTVANFTFSGQPADSEFIRIDDFQYTFKTVLTPGHPGWVKIGLNLNATITNIVSAMSGTGTPGTDYDVLTDPNTVVSGTNVGGTVLRVELTDFSVPGEDVLLSEGSSNITVDVASLTNTSNATVFETVEAWTREFVVSSVTSNRVFGITVTDARAVDGWYDGGVAIFETGDNVNGRGFEVKTWVSSGGMATLFLPIGFAIQVGDTGRIYPGCDKLLATCRDRFDNLLNMRAESYLPGRDAALQYPDAK